MAMSASYGTTLATETYGWPTGEATVRGNHNDRLIIEKTFP